MQQGISPAFRRRRWLIWLALAGAYFFGQFHRVSLNVMVDQIVRDFNLWDAAAVGGLAAAYFYAYAAVQIPTGFMLDSWGARRTLLLGMVLASTGTMVFSATGSIAAMHLARLAIGAGMGVIFVSAAKIFAAWYRTDEFSTTIGLFLFAGNLGAILGTAPLAWGVSLMGWRMAYLLAGIATLMVVVYCWVMVRNEPREAGWEISFSGNGSGTRLSLSAMFRHLGRALWNPATWPPVIAGGGIYGTLMAVAGVWGIPYLMQVYNLSRPTAASFMLMISLGLAAGSPLVGYISDRMRSRKIPYLATALIYVLVWVVLVFWNGGRPPLASLYLLYFCLGFFSSATLLSPVIVKEVNNPEGTGVVVSVGNMGGFLGTTVMQMVLGVALDLGWRGQVVGGVKIYPPEAFQMAFAVCALVALVSAIVLLLSRETRCENIYPIR